MSVVDNLLTQSRDERARVFPSLSGLQRAELLHQLLPGDARELHKALPPEVVAEHISEYPTGSLVGPFGEPLPETCSNEQHGFGTYDPSRDDCVDCSVGLECFCRATGNYYEEMRGGTIAEREEKEKVVAKAAAAIAGKAAKNAFTFDYSSDLFVQETDRFSTARLLLEDKTLDVAEFSKQINGGVQGRYQFFGGAQGDHLLAFEAFRLVLHPQPDRPLGVPWRLLDVQGEEKKKSLPDFFDHCLANGDTDRQVVQFLFWFYYGVGLPVGWRYRFDKPIKEQPKYIWSEYIDPANSDDAAAMVLYSGPVDR